MIRARFAWCIGVSIAPLFVNNSNVIKTRQKTHGKIQLTLAGEPISLAVLLTIPRAACFDAA